MAKRFQETKITQAGNLGTGAAQGLLSLSQKLDQFGAELQQRRLAKVQAKAKDAGVAAGQALDGDQPAFREIGFIGSARDEAFNKGLRNAYVAGLDRDIREDVARIAAESPSNLPLFHDKTQALIKSTLSNVDPSVLGLVTDKLDSIVSNTKIKVQTADIKRRKQEASAEIDSSIEVASNDAFSKARENDREGAAEALLTSMAMIDSAVEGGFITSQQASEKKIEIQKEVGEQQFRGAVDIASDESIATGAEKIDELSSKIPKGWSPDEWDTFISSEQTRLSKKATRQRQQLVEVTAEAKKQAKIARGSLFLDPTVPADPAKSSEDREDVNLYYDSIAPNIAQLPVQEQVNQTVEFIKNTGLIPDQVISASNAAMRSGSVEQVTLVSDLLSRVQEESPASLKDIPNETRAISLQMSDAVRAGIDPNVAIEQARKFTFGLTTQEKETINLQSQELSKGLNSSLQSFVGASVAKGGFDKGVFGGFFFDVPDVSNAMLGEYRSSFNNFMKMTGGNSDQAQKLAYQAIKSTWGITETGGNKRFMKYAPETIYNVAGYDNEWIEDQFNEDMEGVGALNAIIATDHSTARESSPSYPILVENPTTGLLEPLLDENNIIQRWKPDFKETEQFKEVVDAPSKAIQKSKRKRAQNLERRAGTIRRRIQSRLLRFRDIPFNERRTFLESAEGKDRINTLINNMELQKTISVEEARETRKAFGVTDATS